MPCPGIPCLGGGIISKRFSRQKLDEAKRLLARTPVIRDACDLDVLVFLHRHPRTLLTIELLAAFVGYDSKQTAKSLDALIDAGLLKRSQSSTRTARMYLLMLNSPQGGGLKALLELASTREGRQDILYVLDPGRYETNPAAAKQRCPVVEIA